MSFSLCVLEVSPKIKLIFYDILKILHTFVYRYGNFGND